MTIRTLHLINGLGTGGAERSLAELLPDLPAHGIHPEVAVFHRRDEGVEDEVRAAGIPVHHVAATGWFNRIRQVRTLIQRLDPDLVHTTIFEADVVGRVAAARRGPSVLSSVVNTTYSERRFADPNVSRPRLRAIQLIDAATAHMAKARFHAVTQEVRSETARALRVKPERITVVPRGRRRERLGHPDLARRRRVRAQLGYGDEATLLLHIGRQEYQKGHGVLLDAVRPILEQRKDIVLLLAGRAGNASGQIADGLKSFEPGRIIELGHRGDVPDLLVGADLFVFPSHFEGIGGAAIEAMALGTPVVASDLPGLREVLDGVAWFAPPGDPAALSAAVLEALADDAERNRRTALGQARFDDRFEHHGVVNAMATLFHDAT